MKNLWSVFLVVAFSGAQAQYWGPVEPWGRWIDIRALPGTENGDECYEIAGGVEIAELDERFLFTIGSGDYDYGYFKFSGDKEFDGYGGTIWVYMWPPSLITPDMVWNARNVFHHYQQWHHGFCNCDCPEPTLDTLLLAEAFGFWSDDPNYPPNLWGINYGYTVSIAHMRIWMKTPCPPAGPWYGKDPLYFTDSTWVELAPGAVLSGDSRLYVKALLDVDLTSLDVTLFLETSPERDTVVQMTKVPDTREWRGSFTNSRVLGLKSYNTAVAKTTYPGQDTTTWGRATVDVALPKILTQVDTTFTDTVFIRSDSMKVAKDLKVSLRFIKDDSTHQEIAAVSLVDSAGYKYKSRWTANVRVRDTTFFRQFPASPLTYRKWDRLADSCRVTFNHDSLYAVGGKLTIECRGSLEPIVSGNDTLNVDNRFRVNTDTLAVNGTDTLQTRRILIDRDPSNALFLDSLHYDIIKAIAWVEYAGSNDTIRHCHEANRQNPRYNNYWDVFISSQGDTCADSLMPCENTISSATGTMQITRRWWQDAFRGITHTPQGYYRAGWDSLAWSWKINVFNGRYIFLKDNYYQIWHNPEQKDWDSVCVLCSPEDSIPEYENKEDLSSYGYHEGAPAMSAITDKNWDEIMSGQSDGAKYVRNVRGSKYARAWE